MPANKIYCEIITSYRWALLSEAYKAKHPFCECCQSYGIRTKATQVHHKRPIGSASTKAEAEALAFDENNLQSLCSYCHQKAHIALLSHRKTEVASRKEKQAIAAFEGFFCKE